MVESDNVDSNVLLPPPPLLLCCLVVPQVWSNYRQRRILMKPSRFLTELDDTALVETMNLDEGTSPVTTG